MRHCLIGAIALLALGSAGCKNDQGTDMATVTDLSGNVTPDLTTGARDLSGGGAVDMAGGVVDMTGGAVDMAGLPMTAAVAVMDNFYAPKNVTIAKGGKVTWTWSGSGSIPHSVTSGTPAAPDSMFDRGIQMTGTFSFTFPNSGTFQYFCRVHLAAMTGTVTVQ